MAITRNDCYKIATLCYYVNHETTESLMDVVTWYERAMGEKLNNADYNLISYLMALKEGNRKYPPDKNFFEKFF